jgi:hypothetical protein
LFDLRLDAGEVHTAQGHHDFMAVQGGFERDAYRCLWQGHCGRFRLRWWRLAGRFSLAGGWRVQVCLGQLLRSPGNSYAQTVLTELMWRLLIVATVALPVDDMVGRGAPQRLQTGSPEALDPGKPLTLYGNPSSTACPGGAPPRHALLRAAAAGGRRVLGEPLAQRAGSTLPAQAGSGEGEAKMPLVFPIPSGVDAESAWFSP